MIRRRATNPWREAMRQGAVLVVAACVLAAVSNGIRKESIPWVGDWSEVSAGGVEDGLILEIPLEEAQILFLSKEAVFLDARSPEAYARGHIEGARNLPWASFEERAAAVLSDIPKETPIVTYCDGQGCALSTELAAALMARGYDQVRVLANGWSVWVEHGLPTASGP